LVLLMHSLDLLQWRHAMQFAGDSLLTRKEQKRRENLLITKHTCIF